ncbi:MAG: flagellar basal-body MS-ring/collar protein FliF [Pseudomonadota bacterium]
MAEDKTGDSIIAQALGGLGGRARMGLLIVAAAAGTALLVYMFWSPASGNYQVLYSNLAQQDAGEIVAKLKEKGVPFELSGGGAAILVPSAQVYELRLLMASEGLPRGGNVGFEIFDQQSLGQTEFVQKLNYQRALQGELIRTISQFQEVEDARVHIVMPHESVFLDESEPASAAVVLKIRPGRVLSTRQVEGIVHLVSAAVENLKPENVKVVDMSGRTLFAQDDNGPGALSSGQLDYQRSVEDGLKRKVEAMLEKVVGPGKAIARISADLDFTQESERQEIFDPDSAVARTKQTSSESSAGQGGAAAGIPGPDYDLNQPGAGATAGGGGANNSRSQENTSYEINKVAKQIVSPVGSIRRLSVAVIIDGVYQEGQGGAKSFVPRSKKDLVGFEGIIKRTVGFDDERGDQVEVTSIPFALPEELPSEKASLTSKLAGLLSLDTARTAGKLLLALFLVLFVLRPMAAALAKGGFNAGSTTTMTQLPGVAAPYQLPGGGQEAVDVKQQATIMARAEPDKAAALLRGWLANKE